MKHIEAVEIIKGLWVEGTRLTFMHQHTLYTGADKYTKTEIKVMVIVPSEKISDSKVESFKGDTWQEVINKMRIFLEPKGEPNLDEAIEEVDHVRD